MGGGGGADLASTRCDEVPPALEPGVESLLQPVVPAGIFVGTRPVTSGAVRETLHGLEQLLPGHADDSLEAPILFDIASCCLRLGRLDDARQQYGVVAREYAGRSVGACGAVMEAVVNLQMGEGKRAAKLLREYLKAYPEHVWNGKAHEILGDALAATGELADAVEEYDNAVMHAPSQTDRIAALFKVARVLEETGERARAAEAYGGIIEAGEREEIYFRVADAHVRLADLRFAAGRLEEAREHYERVTREYPMHIEAPWALFQLAVISGRTDGPERARGILDELCERYSQDYWCRESRKRREETLADAQEAPSPR
jgi:TolA-binding protein